MSSIEIYTFFFNIIFVCRLYNNEAEFATVNDRIRRGDIVGAKGKPSIYIGFHL